MRERHGLAAASSAKPGLGPPPRSGSYGSVVAARWWPAGTGASAQPGLGPQWIHVNCDRPIGVGLLQGDADEAIGLLLHSLLRNRRTQDVSQQRLATLGVKPARAGGRVQGEPIERRAERLVVRERVQLEWPKSAGPLRPGGRRLARDRGRGEVALGIALAAQVEVIVLGPKEATPAKMSFDPEDRILQHIAHFTGFQMSKARKYKLVPVLVPGAIQSDRMEMRVETQISKS